MLHALPDADDRIRRLVLFHVVLLHTDFQFHFNPDITVSTGEYYFRTVKPVPYPGRTPHIHFAIKMKGRDKWTTQCYIKGRPGNERDGI